MLLLCDFDQNCGKGAAVPRAKHKTKKPMATRRGASAWTRRGAGGTKVTGKKARRLSSDDESDEIRPIVPESESGSKKRKDNPVGVAKPPANKKLPDGTLSSQLRGEAMAPSPDQPAKATRGEKTVSDAESDSDDTELIQPSAATKEKKSAKPPTKSSAKAPTRGKSPRKAAAKSARVARKSKSQQTDEGAPEPISLARFFVESSERPKGVSPARNDEVDVKSVARSDHKFLQAAYQGVQEQNNRLTTLLEGLRESHDRTVLELREDFAKETKRLREVCSELMLYLSVCRLTTTYSTKYSDLRNGPLDTTTSPRTENSFILAADSTGS